MKIFSSGAYETLYDLPLHVSYILTFKCNYRCSYCFGYGKGKIPPAQLPFSTLEQLKNSVENIASLNRPWYDVSFSGGEPTLHPHFFDLINLLQENLKDRLNSLTIISNGSRNLSFYEKIADVAKSINVKLTISIHTDHVDMEHIIELIENLSKHLNFTLALMFNPARREEVHLIYDILFELRKKYPFNINISLLRDDDHVDPRYTQEDFNWRKENMVKFQALEHVLSSKFPPKQETGHSLRTFYDIEVDGERKTFERDYNDLLVRGLCYTNGLLSFTGMWCVANSAVLNIFDNGLCRGMVCDADPFICNIYEKNAFKDVRDYLIHAVQCSFQMCGCAFNDLCPKFSSQVEAVRFIEVARAKQKALFAEYDAAHLNQAK